MILRPPCLIIPLRYAVCLLFVSSAPDRLIIFMCSINDLCHVCPRYRVRDIIANRGLLCQPLPDPAQPWQSSPGLPAPPRPPATVPRRRFGPGLGTPTFGEKERHTVSPQKILASATVIHWVSGVWLRGEALVHWVRPGLIARLGGPSDGVWGGFSPPASTPPLPPHSIRSRSGGLARAWTGSPLHHGFGFAIATSRVMRRITDHAGGTNPLPPEITCRSAPLAVRRLPPGLPWRVRRGQAVRLGDWRYPGEPALVCVVCRAEGMDHQALPAVRVCCGDGVFLALGAAD